MPTFRLARISPAASAREWALPCDVALLIGRPSRGGPAPAIDLQPDRYVSRRHARIWHAEGACWIEDLGSRSATRVNGVPAEPGRPVRLEPGAVIEIGASRLVLLPDEWQLVHHRGRWIEIGLSPAVSYALAQPQFRLVFRLAVYNCTDQPVAGGRLDILLDSYAQASLAVPELPPSSRCVLPAPVFQFDRAALETLGERRWAPCGLRLDAEEVIHTRLGLWILPLDEFSFAPRHRVTLAAFVQPNHPLVATLVAGALAGREVDAAAETVVRAVYEHLHADWHIGYRHEPPHYDSHTQRVRLAHDLLTDPTARVGQGTCLDLALLFAGALEAAGQQPLLALLDLGTAYHALIGCWRERGPRLDPLPVDIERLVSEAVWVDPNGCTRDAAQRRDFAAARAAAADALHVRSLLFALDVGAARHDGVTPIPFTGEPQWDAMVSEALGEAAVCAERAGQPLATVPLLIGFLRSNGLLRHAFAARIGDPDGAAGRLAAALGPSLEPAAASHNYLAVLTGAKVAAKAEGSPQVRESHLLAALLDVRSRALDDALAALGTDRGTVRSALDTVAPGALSPAGDPSVFGTQPVPAASDPLRRKSPG